MRCVSRESQTTLQRLLSAAKSSLWHINSTLTHASTQRSQIVLTTVLFIETFVKVLFIYRKSQCHNVNGNNDRPCQGFRVYCASSFHWTDMNFVFFLAYLTYEEIMNVRAANLCQV